MRTAIALAALFALTCTTSVSANDDAEIAKIKQQLERLQSELDVAKVKIEKLEKEIVELKSLDREKVAADKDPLQLGSKWKGKFIAVHQGKSTTNGATCNVTAREKDTGTFSNTLENGTAWEYDFELKNGTQIKITAVRRIKAANGANTNGLPPVGGTTGKGTIRQDKLTLNTFWKDATGGPLEGRYEFTPVEPVPKK